MSGGAPASFCWFDYETFGTSPLWDRPAQFAAIRTDADLRPLGEPAMFHCRQSDDYLPHPAACRVTGITPEEANAHGVPECRFIERVRRLLGAPGTCSVGYNSVRFDDEFTRHTLFRNLADPYAHEWKDGASRWDLLDVVRLTRALRPDGIVWPVTGEGKPSNRLELLVAANDLEDGRAHDALVDVRATIALARLIRDRQPKLFAHALAHRTKAAAGRLLDPSGPLASRAPVVLVSSAIPAARHHLGVVVPIARHPDNPNAVIVLDLERDPSPLAALDEAAIAARTFLRGRPADAPERLGLHVVALNKCPVVAPLGVLRPSDAERLGIDLAARLAHRDALAEVLDPGGRRARAAGGGSSGGPIGGDDPGGGGTPGDTSPDGDPIGRIRRAMSRPFADDGPPDVDASLYSGGFLSGGDRARLERARAAAPGELAAFGGCFEDPRLDEMLFRYRARNHPDTLDAGERARWERHVRGRLDAPEDAPWLGRAGFARAMREQDWRSEERGLRESLEGYAEALGARAAGPRP